MVAKTKQRVLRCHECGAAMRRAKRQETFTYKGESVKVAQPGWYCTGCDEAIFDGTDMQATESEFFRLKARVDGLLAPDEVRRIRKRLKMTQKRASELLGGGPRAFQKYESGKAMPSRAMSALLALLDNHPELLKDVETLRTQRPALAVGRGDRVQAKRAKSA